MANAIYPTFKEALLEGNTNLNLLDGPVRVSLVDTGLYTYAGTHEFLTDTAGLVANSTALTAQSCISGTFDAADKTLTAVSGNTVEALIFWLDTGTPSTSRVVAYLDTNITGLPVTPNGGDITLTWNASGIFTI